VTAAKAIILIVIARSTPYEGRYLVPAQGRPDRNGCSTRSPRHEGRERRASA
jgi:hypothetical protein